MRRGSHREQTDPYFQAVEMGNLDEIKAFHASGRNVNESTEFGKSGLHIAALHGHTAVIAYFIEKGADVNFNGTKTDLQKKGFDDRGSFRRLPIHDAALSGSSKAIHSLVQAHSSIDEKDGTGSTALHLATDHGQLEAVIALCEHNANLDLTNVRVDSEAIGKTALHIAIKKDHEAIALELIRRGAKIDTKDEEGYSPYLSALQSGNEIILAALIARIEKEEEPGKKQRPTCRPRLNRLGLDFVDEDGDTWLHHAARDGNLDLIEQLLALGADPNALNENMRNSLFLAARHGQLDAMVRLQQDGADPFLTDRYDVSALEIAEKREHHSCADLLREWARLKEVGQAHSTEAKRDNEDISTPASDDDLSSGNVSGAAELLEQFLSEIPQTVSSPEHTALMNSCRNILGTQANAENPEIEEFLAQLNNIQRLDQITSVTTSTGKNLLHVIGCYDPSAALFPDLRNFDKIWVDQLIHQKNTNGETPFHTACRHHHVALFELCVTTLEKPQKLFALAAVKTIREGYNACSLLCISDYDDPAKELKSIVEAEHRPEQPMQRQLTAHRAPHEDQLMLMRRFRSVFGQNADDLVEELDANGNNALMLSIYSGNATLLHHTLDLFQNSDRKRLIAYQPTGPLQLTPLQFICAFGDVNSLHPLLSLDDISLPSVCRQQQLLEWIHYTLITPENFELRVQVDELLTLVTSLYGDDFKNAILRKKNARSLVLTSLHQDGILVTKLLETPHFSRKPDILIDLMCDLNVELSAKTPRSNSQSSFSPRHFPSMVATINQPPPNTHLDEDAYRTDLRKKLLCRIFRFEWPNEILEQMAILIANTLPAVDNTSAKSSDEKILYFIQSQFSKSTRQSLLVNHVLVILPLFHQTLDKNKLALAGKPLTEAQERKLHTERQYIDQFDKNPEMIRRVTDLYHYILKTNPDDAQPFLERIFLSKSLLRAGLATLFPTEDRDELACKPVFIERLKELLTECYEKTYGHNYHRANM